MGSQLSDSDYIHSIINAISTQRMPKKSVEDHLADREGLYNVYYGRYARNISWTVMIYLVMVGLILILDGFRAWGFSLSDKVIMTLLCTTTTNVLGLMFIVAKHLFPNAQQHHGKAS